MKGDSWDVGKWGEKGEKGEKGAMAKQ